MWLALVLFQIAVCEYIVCVSQMQRSWVTLARAPLGQRWRFLRDQTAAWIHKMEPMQQHVPRGGWWLSWLVLCYQNGRG